MELISYFPYSLKSFLKNNTFENNKRRKNDKHMENCTFVNLWSTVFTVLCNCPQSTAFPDFYKNLIGFNTHKLTNTHYIITDG